MAQIRVVQLQHADGARSVARVDEPSLRVLDAKSVFELAQRAISEQRKLAELVQACRVTQTLNYDDVYHGRSEWKLLPPFDHPEEPSKCLVSGTGLTHKASAENRQAMHDSGTVTDSMKMYRIGLEGGRPAPGAIGAEPEWFFKGNGQILRTHGQPLDVPAFADDGGDEAEIAGVYVIGPDGAPYRVGLVQGNEFSDHVLESKNYLYLASSKLRACAIGPELILDPDFSEVRGRAWIERNGQTIWEAEEHSGEQWMSHSLSNLEHHHFKHASHRRPGDVHIHFFGADNFSFRKKLRLEDGDEMVIAYGNFGRALRNPIRIDRSEAKPVNVKLL